MTPQDQQQEIQSVGGETVREQDKIMLVLAYIFIFGLVPLLTVKDSQYVQWHAKQGLVLNVGGYIVTAIVAAIPIVNFFDCLLVPALAVLCILGIVKALRGERWPIPLVADIANKF